MSAGTSIEWADCTWNPWWGCDKISPGCTACYAETWAKRLGMADLWGTDARRREFGDKHWNEPQRWAKTLPAKLGRRPRVFCASMADVFDKNAPAGARDRLWAMIEATPELDWLLLTKRIGNAKDMLPADWRATANGYPNVWLGITVVNQMEADRDIPKLLAIPARVRFLSCEPLLGALDLSAVKAAQGWDIDALRGEWRKFYDGGFDQPSGEEVQSGGPHIDWVISGGESGPKARPSNPQWFRSLRDQCTAARVAYLHKQNGEWASLSEVEGAGAHHYFDDGRGVRRVGKKAAGRMLDGVEHNGFPETR